MCFRDWVSTALWRICRHIVGRLTIRDYIYQVVAWCPLLQLLRNLQLQYFSVFIWWEASQCFFYPPRSAFRWPLYRVLETCLYVPSPHPLNTMTSHLNTAMFKRRILCWYSVLLSTTLTVVMQPVSDIHDYPFLKNGCLHSVNRPVCTMDRTGTEANLKPPEAYFMLSSLLPLPGVMLQCRRPPSLSLSSPDVQSTGRAGADRLLGSSTATTSFCLSSRNGGHL